MSADSSLNVRVSRRFDAAPERVFDAWIEPEMVGRWMSMPGRDEVLKVSTDPRVGGRFSFLLRRAGQDIDHVGEYLEVERPHRLAFTWGAGIVGEAAPDMSSVFIDIVPRDAGCELTLTHELHPAWRDFAARTEAGWTAILNAMAESLA